MRLVERDWRRASDRKGEPAGRWLVTRGSFAESKRSRRPGRTTRRHDHGGGSDGTPSMYASQRTPSLAENGIDSVRALPRGYNGVSDTGVTSLSKRVSRRAPTVDQYIPPMPPPAPAMAGFSSFFSTTTHSVVRSRPAIDAAFCSAVRATLVGSMTPAFTRSS